MTQKFYGKGYIAEIAYNTGLIDCCNVYVDLNGRIRPRHNPTPGLYYFDGQIFFKRKAGQ